jgi:hypothetical protein
VIPPVAAEPAVALTAMESVGLALDGTMVPATGRATSHDAHFDKLPAFTTQHDGHFQLSLSFCGAHKLLKWEGGSFDDSCSSSTPKSTKSCRVARYVAIRVSFSSNDAWVTGTVSRPVPSDRNLPRFGPVNDVARGGNGGIKVSITFAASVLDAGNGGALPLVRSPFGLLLLNAAVSRTTWSSWSTVTDGGGGKTSGRAEFVDRIAMD